MEKKSTQLMQELRCRPVEPAEFYLLVTPVRLDGVFVYFTVDAWGCDQPWVAKPLAALRDPEDFMFKLRALIKGERLIEMECATAPDLELPVEVAQGVQVSPPEGVKAWIADEKRRKIAFIRPLAIDPIQEGMPITWTVEKCLAVRDGQAEEATKAECIGLLQDGAFINNIKRGGIRCKKS